MGNRYWAFTDLTFEYKGFNVPELYRATWNAILDRGYTITEYKYGHVFMGETQGVVAHWAATAEVEKKYVLTGIMAFLKLVWRNVPKPGTSGENAPKVPQGNAIVKLNGFVLTDYLGIWSSSPFLSPFISLREKLLYKRRIDVLKAKVRQDAEGVIKDLQETVSFFPKLM